MKKLIILSCALFLLVSCKKSNEETEKPITEMENIDTLSSDVTIDTTSLDTSVDISSNNDLKTISENGSEDYDKMLDDYDEYVTEYAKFYKKAMKGDQSAMTEYPAMLEKTTKLQESMKEAQGKNQLSVKQITRMSKIQTKMLQAMQ